MNRIFTALLLFIIVGILPTACSDSKKRGTAAPITSQGYTFAYPPLSSTTLQTGENPVFKLQINTNEDLFLDRIGIRLESSNASIRKIEVREMSTSLTVPNSVNIFTTPPPSPLDMSLVMNQSISEGTSKTYIVLTELQAVTAGSALRMQLFRIDGRTRFAEIAPLTTAVVGETLFGK